MRRAIKRRKPIGGDALYHSPKVTVLINYTMKEGKKSTARAVVYGAFEHIKTKMNVANPVEVYEQALENAAPLLEVRSRRIGGATYQVPREVRPERRLALALRWILGVARAKKGRPMDVKLADELMAAAKNEGDVIKKRENTHKMAEANRAFAHFNF